ncbi:hypothetical protein DFH06DRAFT_1213564 [Mycena polygramma]|nr:hypothetical protein DFH06DRAFT_1213564 [Mycena polygramma]
MEEDSDEESWSASGNDSNSLPTRPSAKSLGKAKAKSPSPAPSFVVVSDAEDDFPNLNPDDDSDYFPMVTLPPAIAPAVAPVALPIASTLPTGGAVTAPAPAVVQTPATAIAPQPAAVATTGPQPHPSLSSPPSSPRASRYSNYSMYSTFTSKHFMMWDSGDFEVDPHFWTRPHEIDSVMDT